MVVFFLLSHSLFSQPKTTDEYIVDTLQLKSKVFNNTRTIRVLLPPGYFDKQNENILYPVLYLNDGVTLFHAYNLKETVHTLIAKKSINPFIIVGIDNGASTKESTNPMRDRANEYLPWPDLSETNPDLKLDSPKGKQYPDFLINEVMPHIKNNFRIKEGAVNTGLGSSSYGGLAALYTAIHYPAMFGMLLLESPSLYVYNKQILKEEKA
jgi:enterochelin esterase-like enzyme